MTLQLIIDCSIAFLALINPISKLFVVSTLSEKLNDQQVRYMCIKAACVAAMILVLFTLCGSTLLGNIFHVQIYSFKIAGGFVLALRGLQAVQKGLFFETPGRIHNLEDILVVPLASPMIAGPATIAATISFPATYGMLITLIAIIAASAMNLVVMLFSRVITVFLMKHHVLGALIRITGLIVATMGIQMIADGIHEYACSAR